MKTISQQLEAARSEAAEHKATWIANKEKTDNKSRKVACEAAERLEWATDKVAMLDAMSRSEQFKERD